MYAETLPRNRDTRRTLSRLAIFCTVSIALHSLTLLAYRPAGVAGGPDLGAASVLHATLNRAVSPVSDSPDVAAPEISSDASTAGAQQEQHARAGAADGVRLPLPEKWFAAQELDVRAEPLHSVTIDYPAELVGSGVVGRVQLLLYIDEHGRVRKADVEQAAPEGVFDKAAIEAWINVRFKPAMKDGVTVKSQKLLELSYLPY